MMAELEITARPANGAQLEVLRAGPTLGEVCAAKPRYAKGARLPGWAQPVPGRLSAKCRGGDHRRCTMMSCGCECHTVKE